MVCIYYYYYSNVIYVVCLISHWIELVLTNVNMTRVKISAMKYFVSNQTTSYGFFLKASHVLFHDYFHVI